MMTSRERRDRRTFSAGAGSAPFACESAPFACESAPFACESASGERRPGAAGGDDGADHERAATDSELLRVRQVPPQEPHLQHRHQ
eukprot:6079486-Pyramimonas_sp.AAC.1